MKKFHKEILVTESEWKNRLDSYLERKLKHLEAESLRDEPFEEFFKTGDLAKFIENCIAEGSDPARGWGFVFACNPNRDYVLLKRNIKYFWDWLLEDLDAHLPKGSVFEREGEDRKTIYFGIHINDLGTVNSSVLDPVCAAKLFLWVYGEEFEPTRTFPISFGQCGWTPIIEVNPVERFTNIISLLRNYLYEDDPTLEYRQCLALVDYWFSIIPHLKDLRIFDTVLHEDRDAGYPRRQRVVRAFLAYLAGYDVYGEHDELPHTDPELEEYIKNRLAETEMPVPYYRLLEYIEEHKENSLGYDDDD
jgi:hypothetical protein